MQRANLLDWLQNLQVVAAFRCAMMIFLHIFDERRFRYRVGVGVLLSVQDEINFNWSKLLIAIPESDWFCGFEAGLKY